MLKAIVTAAVIGVLSTAAQAATFDSFDLVTSNPAGSTSNLSLTSGQAYEITVSGTFELGTNAKRHLADAEYFNLRSNPLNPLDRTTSLEIGVGIIASDSTRSDIDFGAYRADSTYSFNYIGTGEKITLFYSDNPLTDNIGTLQVAISAVPLPAGALLLLTGLGGLGLARRHRKS